MVSLSNHSGGDIVVALPRIIGLLDISCMNGCGWWVDRIYD